MSDIYWITRIGCLQSVFEVVVILGVVLLVAYLLLFPLVLDVYTESEEWAKKLIRKANKTFFVAWAISLIGYFFTPSQKELIVIYGVGSTIDYIKSSDKAQKLPDKAIEALTRYLDSVEKED